MRAFSATAAIVVMAASGVLLTAGAAEPTAHQVLAGASAAGANSLPQQGATHDPSFATEHFSGSGTCSMCHDGISDSAGNDVSIVEAWQGTMMASSSIDPLWRAKVASEVKRNPSYAAAIEAKCSRCHMPMAHTEATFADAPVALAGEGFFNPDNAYHDAALDGVSCTLCHQIEDAPELGTDVGFSGGFSVADKPPAERMLYGPYTLPRTRPMQMHVSYTPAYSEHVRESELCATCHNLDTPVIDAQGHLSDAHFPEQAVYTEWENSAFAETHSCQSCHMAQAEGGVVISTHGGNLQTRSPFSRHNFDGANTYMLDIIRRNREALGALAKPAAFDASISGARDQLLAAAEVEIAEVILENELLSFQVHVDNRSGHKLPTSFPSRRVWLHVAVIDDQGESVFESGAMDDRGRIAGVDDELAIGSYQPHTTKITGADQVQIYETVMADTDGSRTHTLMNASRYLKDNRILPVGFKPDAPASVQPHGAALQDGDFVAGGDTVSYEIADLAGDSYTVVVVLRHQVLSFGFAQDLFRDVDLPDVARMFALDGDAAVRSEPISSAMVSIGAGMPSATPPPTSTTSPTATAEVPPTPTADPTHVCKRRTAWLPLLGRGWVDDGAR